MLMVELKCVFFCHDFISKLQYDIKKKTKIIQKLYNDTLKLSVEQVVTFTKCSLDIFHDVARNALKRYQVSMPQMKHRINSISIYKTWSLHSNMFSPVVTNFESIVKKIRQRDSCKYIN